jgi:hypothetical protein
MKPLAEEPRSPVTERGTKADQNSRAICWADPSAWIPPLALGLLLALVVRRYGVNIPFGDDFDSPGRVFFDVLQGNFTWHSLWQQHNESRLVVPRIIWLVEAFTVGWSTKHWMYASVVMCALEAYLLALLLNRIVRNRALKWMAAGCVSLLLLHPQFAPETFLRGSQGIVLVPSLFIVLGSFLYSSEISFHAKLVLYVVLAEVSTLTFANGMIVWVLGFPVFPLLHELRDSAKDRRKIVIPTVLACLCAIASIGSYFVDFEGSPIIWPDNGLPGFLRYFFSWTGAGLASIGNRNAAFVCGLCLLGVAAVFTAIATAQAVRHRTLTQLERSWPWLALLIYVLVSGVINTLTRAETFGIGNALAGRYYLITMQMTIGLAGLLPLLVCYRADESVRTNQSVRVALASVILLSGIFYALAGWQQGLSRCYGTYRALERWKMALSLWREAPFISPLPITLAGPPPRSRVHYLTAVAAGLCPDYSQGWWLTKALQDALSRPPVGEVRVRGRGEKLNASGWAMHPVARTPFPAVLTVIAQQNSELTPIWVELMNRKGPPLPDRLDTGESYFLMGFNTYPLKGRNASAPAEQLLFFAIDPEHREAYLIRRVP